MKLGVFTVILGDLSLDETLNYLKSQGVQELEIGVGGFPGTAHADAIKFLNDPAALDAFRQSIAASGLKIAALAVHGNPVHPNPDIANRDHAEFEAAVLLAEILGVQTVVTFSGCPGDSEQSLYPNWVIASWPPDFQIIREWQWQEKLIPYWRKAGQFAADHQVRVAIEMHPGFSVYNPTTLLQLREAVGPSIGVNFDPSHLFWQGIDPVAAIRALKGTIYHFHAKDTKIDVYNTAVKGVLATSKLSSLGDRPWNFRSVGYGHGEETWRAIFSELRLAGYDGIISIEHEDGLMTPREGLEKAINVLKRTIIFEDDQVNMFWA